MLRLIKGVVKYVLVPGVLLYTGYKVGYYDAKKSYQSLKITEQIEQKHEQKKETLDDIIKKLP